MSTPQDARITWRFAQPTDLDFIYRSLKKIAEDDGYIAHFFLTPNDVKEALFYKTAHSECLISEYNKTPVALMLFTVMHLNFNRFHKPGLYVHDLFVEKEYRRHGVAKVLGNAVKEVALSRGCDRIDGILPKSNQGATAFYQTIEDIKVLDYIHYMRLHLK